MACKNTINLPPKLQFWPIIVSLYPMCRFLRHTVICIASVVLAVSLADACGVFGKCETAVDEPIETVSDIRSVKLLFVGDMMCHTPQIVAARTDSGYDFRPSFAAVKPWFDRADISIVNLETTISPDGRYAGYPNFSSPAEFIDALKWLGVDVALLANNHCCDRGRRGIKATIDKLDECGIAHTGVFRDLSEYRSDNPLWIVCNGLKFAVMNYTYGTNGMYIPDGHVVNLTDTLAIEKDLAEAAEADCRIVCMHWGDEYVRRPNRHQRELADFLFEHGADIVVGSHPHVVQHAEIRDDGRPVFYSLGNFVSNQRKRFCDGGIIAEIEVVKRDTLPLEYRVSVTPAWVMTPGYRILPPHVGDTTSMTQTQRMEYETFMKDTELLFSRDDV